MFSMDDSINDSDRSVLLVPANSSTINVAHPGITIRRFIDLSRIGYTPQAIRIVIQEFNESTSDVDFQPKDAIKVWNALKSFEPTTFNDLVAMQRITCGLALLPSTFEMVQLKMNIIHSVFRRTSKDWDIHPIYIHTICKELLPFLHDNRNLMFFIRMIASISQMAFNVSVSLAWSALFVWFKRDVKMHRVYAFQTMLDMLKPVDVSEIKNRMNEFYSLFDIVAFLVNVIILRKSETMISHRFYDYFTHTTDQIEEMVRWAEAVTGTIQLRNNNIENVDTVLVIELLNFDILEPLSEVLADLKNET